MKTGNENQNQIDTILKQAMSGEVPAEVESRVRRQFRTLRERLERHEAAGRCRRLFVFLPGWARAVPLAAAVVVMLIVAVMHWLGAPGVALAEVLEHVRSAQTLTFKVTVQPKLMSSVPPQVVPTMVLEPGRVRQTLPGGVVMIIDRSQGKSLVLQPAQKRAIILAFAGEKWDQSAGGFVDSLRELQDGAEEELGRRQIDGRPVVGFHISGLRNNGWDWTIWADEQTGLPVRVEVKVERFGIKMPVVMSDFVFNIDLDESLFSMTPPEGYTLQEMQVDISAPSERDLIEGLRSVTAMTDGMFPAEMSFEAWCQIVTRRYSDVPSDAGNISTEAAEAALKLVRADAFVQRLKPENDWYYAGKGVKLGEAEKPICWWRPQDSVTYRVVYGDLSVRELAGDQLPTVQPAPVDRSD